MRTDKRPENPPAPYPPGTTQTGAASRCLRAPFYVLAAPLVVAVWLLGTLFETTFDLLARMSEVLDRG